MEVGLKCIACNKIITKKVSEYSLKEFDKELCFECQNIVKEERYKAKIPTETIKTETKTEEPKSQWVNIKGKQYLVFAGVLDQAHKKGLQELSIINMVVDFEKKSAYCVARAEFKDGSIFYGAGSSTPQNTGVMVQAHFVEMACTRAFSRCLRVGLNIGEPIAEEMPEVNV